MKLLPIFDDERDSQGSPPSTSGALRAEDGPGAGGSAHPRASYGARSVGQPRHFTALSGSDFDSPSELPPRAIRPRNPPPGSGVHSSPG